MIRTTCAPLAFLAAALWLVPASAQEAIATLMSKDDAEFFFSLTREEWIANLEGVIADGIAETPEGFIMIVSTFGDDTYYLNPVYESPDADALPAALQVTIAYPDFIAQNFEPEEILDAAEQAHDKMLPEFLVVWKRRFLERGVAIEFFIARAGIRFPARPQTEQPEFIRPGVP
jgi:hypothetical protein